MNVRLSRLCALILILCCLPSCKTVEPVFVPPPINCGAYELPKVKLPTEPRPGEKDPAMWQLWGIGWQAVADHVLGQRLETARCLHQLKQQGVIK